MTETDLRQAVADAAVRVAADLRESALNAALRIAEPGASSADVLIEAEHFLAFLQGRNA